MSDEIVTRQNMPPASGTVQQEGKNNFYVENQAGATLNVTYNISGGSSEGSAEQMIAVQSFSREYYQLIVTCEEDVFTSNMVTVPVNRALTQYYVPSEIFERCSTLSETGMEELKRFPAIICRENTGWGGETDSNQWAMFAYIKKIRVMGKNIKVVFQPLAPIQQKKLCDKKNAVYFDLNMDCAITDLNHSAWSVHKADIFEAFREAGIVNIPVPA